jgi:hypothetical protein
MKKRSAVSILSIFTLCLVIGLVFSRPVSAEGSQNVEEIKAYGALDGHAIYADPNPDAEVTKGFNFNLKTVTIKKSYPGTDYILNGSYGSTPGFTGGLQHAVGGKKRVWLTVHNLDAATCALVRCKVKSSAPDWRTTLIKGESVTSKNEYLTHTDFYSDDFPWNIDDEVSWLTVLSPDGDSSLLTVVLKIGSGSWRHFITVRYSAIYPSGLSGGYSSINEPGASNPFIIRSAVFGPTLMETFSGRNAEFGRLYLLGPSGKNRHTYVVRGSELFASVGIDPQPEGKSEYRFSLGSLATPIDYSGGKNLAELVVDSISITAKNFRQSVRDEAKVAVAMQEQGKKRAADAGVPYVSEKQGAIAINYFWGYPSGFANADMTWLAREVKISKSGDATYFSIIGNWTPPFYLGIQESHNPVTGEIRKNAIFSAWDTYEGNDCTNCGPETRPSNGRTTVVKLGEGVTGGNGFGYEGTGVNAFINDFGWKVGDTVRAVVNLRPLDDGAEISAAVQLNSQPWRFFGTYKYAKKFIQLEPGYSFIEDFGTKPWIVRSATFGKTWMENENQTISRTINEVTARANEGLNSPYHLISPKEDWGLWAQIGGDEYISKRDPVTTILNQPDKFSISLEARLAALDLKGDERINYLLNLNQAKSAAELRAKQEAEAKAAAELKAKQEAEAKAATELKAKQDAEAKAAADKAAAELKAKQEAEAKAKAAELKAKQEAEVKAAAELKAKQEAEAKAAELKAKQEAEVKAAAELKAKQEVDAKAAAIAAANKKTTITCIKGKLTKKVTAIKPKCPTGYKLKK